MHVTVCIATRDRGTAIRATLQALQQQCHSDFDVLIVDQSSSDDTANLVRSFVEDPRIRYCSTGTVGRSASLNIAIAMAQGPLLAFTDDDCLPAPEWLAVLVTYFAANPEVGQVSGPVLATPYDRTRGIIPGTEFGRLVRISSPWRFWNDRGIGANQTFRLDALRQAGPFDELLGTGTVFCSCEDLDMTYRVLKAGYTVLNVPDALVYHYGFRPNAELAQHRRNIAIGLGGMYVKHLRSGDPAILPSFLNIYARAAVPAVLHFLVRFMLPTRVHRWMRSMSWKRLPWLRKRIEALPPSGSITFGARLSFRYGIDRQLGVYTQRST